MDCEICRFNNPKATATAAIIRDNKILLLKRGKAPFKDKWDLPGGYLNKGELPKDALQRELEEELGVDSELTYITQYSGVASWDGKEFAVISSFFLADIGNQNIKLNTDENTEASFVSLKDLKIENIAFDTNRNFLEWLKSEFTYDLDRVRELIRQLDQTAMFNEYSLYEAKLNGYISTRYENDQLIGMGWIFPRKTMLRKQAVIEDMIVDEKYRGKGLGRDILNDLVTWAKENKIEIIELTSNPKRVAANELYKKYGFNLHPTNHYLYKV